VSLRPGMPSAGLSARKPGPDHKAINPNRLPTVFLRRMDCDLHEIGWIQEDWKHEYPSSRHSRCECKVGTKERYCSDYCADADDAQETEIQCDCKHSPCALG